VADRHPAAALAVAAVGFAVAGFVGQMLMHKRRRAGAH
jgi:hypothetical protein